MSGFDAVVEHVRERVDPTAEEQDALAAAAERLAERAENAIADLEIDGDVVLVGSTARGTWVAGDRDIDLFVRFSPDLPRAELEANGLKIGNTVLPDGREEYAEHPYVHGTFEGYDVDLVPCYRVETATQILSAVDRTPFHNAYLESRLDDDLAGDVRLFKQFLKGIGAYGSDLRTRGFSGYLTELLILEYGGFRETLDAIQGWGRPIHLDPENHGAVTFSDPLVVVDPTDPERNVAAVVSETNVARVQHHSREFLADPDEDAFKTALPDSCTPAEIRTELDRREAISLAVVFDAPNLVEDQLYPQLYRSRDGLVRGLESRGFSVLRAATWADERAVLFVELEVATLPRFERHEGPPVHVSEHAEGFYEKYAESDAYGPFVDGDRYVVERERDVQTAHEFATSYLDEVALGAHIESIVERGDYDVLLGESISTLADEFGEDFARYFNPSV